MTRTLEIVRGARAAEARLLAFLETRRRATQADPALLGRPLRVIVPSASLRKHLNARIAHELGATAGIEVRTLFATALEILAVARIEGVAGIDGETSPRGELLFELLARREAAGEPLLREALAGLEAGYRAAVDTVRDLFDAGFEPVHAEALAERLGRGGASADRARAILGVATRLSDQLQTRSAELPALLFSEARRLVERNAHGRSWSGVFIHGFADVTGRAGDFLEALFRHFPATVLLDEPPDPCDPARTDAGASFSERMRQRFEGQAQEVLSPEPENTPAPTFTFLRTPGPEAEARAVAERIQKLLAAGARPESIVVCARELTPHKSALRAWFEGLGVPFSAPDTKGFVDGPARTILALLELMRKKGRTSTQRWLDGCAHFLFRRTVDGKARSVTRRPSPDLRLALRAAGGGRLEDVARLDVPALLDTYGAFRLPARTGLRAANGATAAKDDEAQASRRIAGTYAPHRRFRGDDLRIVVADATRICKQLEDQPERASIADHLEHFAELRHKHLGWSAGDPAEQRIQPTLEELAHAFAGETLQGVEFLWLLERTLMPLARSALSGQPAQERVGESGVQILGAMAARARTSEHLFLIGLNRDSFPRVVGEDPLLPDALRGGWSELLPDIPIKARGRDEERYLFAQLASSSPNVTFSWQTNDAEGKARVLSPLLERFGLEERTVEEALPVFPTNLEDVGVFFAGGPRTAWEHAVLAGLVGGPEALAPRLQLALEETDLQHSAPTAAARIEVLRAFESKDPERLLPWLGWLGPQQTAPARPDPVQEPLFITRVEDAVDCMWRLALAKILRIEEAPDPLERLAGIEPRVLGSLVHEVLERIARASWEESAQTNDLTEALAREARITKWPSHRALERLTDEVAQEHLARQGLHEPGLCRLICHVALPHIERAQAILQDEASRHEEGTGGCVGVELLGEATAQLSDGQTLRVRFKADRVDRLGERLVLSDFKTGKLAVRESEFLKKLVQGKNLQPSAYVHGVPQVAGPSPAKVRARLMYLNPEVEEDRHTVVLKRESAAADDWVNALKPVRDAWHAGVFFPRLTDPTGEREHDRCRMCDVSAACLRGDSSARSKLLEIVQGEKANPELSALRELWEVARAKKASGDRR